MKKNMKKMNLFLILPLLLLFLAGCGNKNLTNSQKNINSVPETTAPLTMAELVKHNSATDCWQLINGQIYDLSSYISSGSHPDGNTIIQGCGQDATTMFKKIGKHNGKAQAILPGYLLGAIQ
jgi:cytochrome b involved in lipid metabolism